MEQSPEKTEGQDPLRIEEEQSDVNEAGDPTKAKSGMGVFELPAGYLSADGKLHKTVYLEEMTGVEEDILSSPGGEVIGKLNMVMGNCIKKIGDVEDKKEIRAAVPRLPLADRNFLIIAMRRVSLGDEFTMEVTCSRCGKEQSIMLDLSTLEIKQMEDPMRREFDLNLPSGRAVSWKVMTGEEEDVLAKIREATNKDLLTYATLVRITSLDGSPLTVGNRITDARGKVSLDKAGRSAFAVVKKLSARDRNALRVEFQNKEGGVDTEVEYVCDKCSMKVKAEFDPAQIGFFFPSGA